MNADNGSTGSQATGSGRSADPLPSDPAAIEALIAQRRAELASTIDELVERAHPREIARRSAQDARERARSFAFTTDGEPRSERLVAVVAAGAVLMGLMLLLRHRRR